MGEALGVLGLMVFLGVIFVVIWVLSGAASRYDQRRKSHGRLVAGSIWGDLQDALVAIGSGIGTLTGGLAVVLGSLIGCLLFFVLGLVGLFFVVWVIKRMWEMA
jgi:hypothetical protein